MQFKGIDLYGIALLLKFLRQAFSRGGDPAAERVCRRKENDAFQIFGHKIES